MSDKWHFILSSDCPIYHIFVSTATHQWNMVPLGTGRPRVSSAQGSRSLERVTYPTCGGAWPNVLSGASDTRRDPSDTRKASGSERMRGHTRQGCSQRPRVRPSSGYGAAQAATRARHRRCAPAPPPPHRSAVAVAYGSAHGRPHHRWHHARHPRAPTAVAPTQPTATPAVLAAPTAVGRAPPRMPQPSRLSVVAGPAALETAAPSSQPTSATASASTAAVRNRYHRRPHYRRRHAPAAAPAPPPPPSAATGGVRRRRLR